MDGSDLEALQSHLQVFSSEMDNTENPIVDSYLKSLKDVCKFLAKEMETIKAIQFTNEKLLGMDIGEETYKFRILDIKNESILQESTKLLANTLYYAAKELRELEKKNESE